MEAKIYTLNIIVFFQFKYLLKVIHVCHYCRKKNERNDGDGEKQNDVK